MSVNGMRTDQVIDFMIRSQFDYFPWVAADFMFDWFIKLNWFFLFVSSPTILEETKMSDLYVVDITQKSLLLTLWPLR